MKIEHSFVKMSSETVKYEKNEHKLEFEMWGSTNSNPAVAIHISQEGKDTYKSMCEKTQECKETNDKIDISPEDKLKILLIEKLLSKITGKKIKFKLLERLKIEDNLSENEKNISNASQNNLLSSGFRLSISYLHESTFKFSFSTSAVIKTQDGKEFNINLNVNISHQFTERFDLRVLFGNQKNVDPLVINFDGRLPSLSAKTFEFDLDVDSKLDSIPLLMPGNGFLAQDLNQNGKIDNGTELFGPTSNNGFLELSKYDLDKNGWIDENDPIFSRLFVWIKTESEDKILTLKELNIGAISLGNTDSKYSVYNSNSQKLLGNVQKTGFYVFENGKAGVLQHIDVVI